MLTCVSHRAHGEDTDLTSSHSRLLGGGKEKRKKSSTLFCGLQEVALHRETFDPNMLLWLELMAKGGIVKKK